MNQHLDENLLNSTVGDTPSANDSSDHVSVDTFFGIPEEVTSSTITINSVDSFITKSTYGFILLNSIAVSTYLVKKKKKKLG